MPVVIKRYLEKPLKKLARKYPIVTMTGPRQSGKTTLARHAFPGYRYVSLEDPDTRLYAADDPRGFLADYDERVIIDEVQRVPNILSYLQTSVDERPTAGRYILTGSQQLLLNEKISQSLAGRSAILRLLPFSLAELLGRKLGKEWLRRKARRPEKSLFEVMRTGFYPRIHDRKLDPGQWYRDYFETYITRDVRVLLEIGDLKSFEKFVFLLAARSGQLLNLTSLGNDTGVSHTTAKRWISILEASYIIMQLQPHFRNFNKRLIKAPKIYFLDPGLLCYLLKIHSAGELSRHALVGQIFETFIVGELLKWHTHQGKESPLFFWRDRSGAEIDLLIESAAGLFPVEIKAAQTVTPTLLKPIKDWLNLPGNKAERGVLVYGGGSDQSRNKINVAPWYAIG